MPTPNRNNFTINKRPILLSLLLVLLFAATQKCNSYPTFLNNNKSLATEVDPKSIPRVQSPTADLSLPTLTDVSSQLASPPFPTSLPSQISEPLRFTFPTLGADPISIWRPPLYPTPWEPTPHDHFYFSRPIGANEINWPLARYRYGGSFRAGIVHTGIDIPAPKGTPVLAAGPGFVTWAGYGLYLMKDDYRDPYGIAVVIKHDFGYIGMTIYSVYGHLDEHFVIRGQLVDGGDPIGLVGETGNVTGPHLHFEVRLGDNQFSFSRNPELWIAPPQGWGILAGRIMDVDGGLLKGHTVYIRSNETNHHWTVNTYSGGAANSDSYYRENMVIGDLPAGSYTVWTQLIDIIYKTEIVIKPGMVSYLQFKGKKGFEVTMPPSPSPEFVTPEAVPTSTLDK